MPATGTLRLVTPRSTATSIAGLVLALSALSSHAFGFDDVARLAGALAAHPYREPTADPAATGLTYDAWRAIRFKPERSLWRNLQLPIELQFFATTSDGGRRRLDLFEIDGDRVRPIEVPPSSFTSAGPREPAAGAAGWRAHYPLNRPDYKDEVIAFLGASYFRAVGAGQVYGASARGVAVDTVGGQGEEFPAFTAFWIERPAAHDGELRGYALLDGRRVAGAYAFRVVPGTTTTVDVRARLWLRTPVATLGLAPLSSMYLSGENQPGPDDYRPEVHDSDGLQVEAGNGEWLWRPLTNPARAFVTSFALRSPRGFGLLQRDRRFASYEDLETHYERRPSVWVEPLGDWGEGRVELLQFRTHDDANDNIAAYWVPATLPPPGQPLERAWRLHWAGAEAPGPPAARVVQSRIGHGYRPAGTRSTRAQFHIDFAPVSAADAVDVQAIASAGDNVRGLHAIAYPNPELGGVRVTLDYERVDPTRAVELRAFLRQGNRTLSETWSYALAPE